MNHRIAQAQGLKNSSTRAQQNHLFHWLALICSVIIASGLQHVPTVARTPEHNLEECQSPGWNPHEYNLKDHTIFSYQDQYYLISNLVGAPFWEARFIYAVSDDLCTWEELGFLLTERRPDAWDELAIWAPHVIQHEGTFYMFYTGVNRFYAQSIFLATSTNPADPASWIEHGVVFQPAHPGSLWEGFYAWSDCRDPFIWVEDDQFRMVYTGRDVEGGIIGLATAPAPAGPWQDHGPLILIPDVIPESPVLLHHEVGFYLIANETGGNGSAYRYLEQFAGPASGPFLLIPGWAHEFWQGLDGKLYSSYLTFYGITISPVSWDNQLIPPRLFLSASVSHAYLPVTGNFWQPPDMMTAESPKVE